MFFIEISQVENMKKNFKTEYLKKHGVENRDWIFVGKNSMSSTWCCHHYSENIYYFKVPAWPEKEDLKLDCNHKFFLKFLKLRTVF